MSSGQNSRDEGENESIIRASSQSQHSPTRTHALESTTLRQHSSIDDVYIFVDHNLRVIRLTDHCSKVVVSNRTCCLGLCFGSSAIHLPSSYTLYAVGAVGALILARSLHVHKKFNKLSDIPVNFISKNVPFRASVKALDREHILHVDHLPIVTYRWIPFTRGVENCSALTTTFNMAILERKYMYLKTVVLQPYLESCVNNLQDVMGFRRALLDNFLPIKLAGLHITPVGSKWLAENVLHRSVKITPLSRNSDVLDSIVYLEKGLLRRSQCINKALVEQGLCTVDYPNPLPTSGRYMNLLDSLIGCETKADRKGKGLWGKAVMDSVVKQQHRWSLRNAWKWLCGKFVKWKI